MSRPARTWAVFGLCVLLVATALGWMTHRTLSLEAAERDARTEAERQETIRLALWSADSALVPFLAQEASRSFQHYSAMHALEPMFNVDRRSPPQEVPSPLLQYRSPYTRIHFQVDCHDVVTSPQVPADEDLAARFLEGGPGGPRALLARLKELGVIADLRGELARRGHPVSTPEDRVANPGGYGVPQQVFSNREFSRRNDVNVQSQMALNGANNFNMLAELAVDQSILEPVWLERGGTLELFLVRSVSRGADELLQGIWLNWPEVRTWLTGIAAALAPAATLEPDPGEPGPDPGNRLAGIPAILELPASQPTALPTFTPARVTLVLAWLAVLGAVGAVGFVLRTSMSLSERRGRFVSAVTHELRSPLTTFRMYAQMLADGMVKDDDAKAEYLETLAGESDRLARVVESVLLYSRIERDRGGVRTERVAAADLFERLWPPLAQRADEAEMTLDVACEVGANDTIEVDGQALEQILTNLVDNACKYATEASDRAIRLRAETRGRTVRFVVADRGPGVPAGDEATIFEPFVRSAAHRAGPVSGVGLGLALARELARAQGGDLVLERSDAGATFAVELPLV